MDAQPPNPGQSQPTPDGAGPGRGDAADLAAEALKAAQSAVSSLKKEAGISPSAPSAPDAVQAAQAAIAQAKAANGESAQPAASRDGAPKPFDLPSFGAPGAALRPEGIDLLADVNLNVKIELGRTRMLVEDVLRLGEGSVVELDKLAGDPVDVYVNDRHVARGEVLVLNDNFCVRINEIVSTMSEQVASR